LATLRWWSAVPELPEVETIRRGLVPRMAGRTIVRVELLDARLVQPAPTAQIARALQGRRIEALGRRGK
jgi:formamidopyrimidine-DNA glycosylase